MTSLMVTKFAPEALACSTKSFQLSGVSSSKMTLGTSSETYAFMHRRPLPAMKATMSSLRERRLSTCMYTRIVAEITVGKSCQGYRMGGRREVVYRYLI